MNCIRPSVSAFVRSLLALRPSGLISCRFGLIALLCFLAAWAIAPAAFAQTPPIYPGTSQALPPLSSGSGCEGVDVWSVSGPNLYATSSNSQGWNVTYSVKTSTFQVTAPAGTPTSNGYTVNYGLTKTGSGENIDFSGPYADFNVLNLPVKPAPGTPAFSWQGSVAGVNTGNGNKTTTLPIVGWTQRGGMPVSFALIHNSQSTIGIPAGPAGFCGPKWQMSYLTYLTNTGGSPTLYWDNGLSYAFTKTGTGTSAVYTPIYGILDKLAYNSSGQFTLTTTDNTVYTFGSVTGGPSGTAYLLTITDEDGNTLTINHNSDTTIHSIVDNANRAVTLGYSGGRLSSASDPLGRQWTFGYTGAGDLWYVIDPAIGNTYSYRAFAYDAYSQHDITQTQDHNNNQSYFGYNSDSSLAWARDSLGNQTNFAYGTSTTTITDPNGHTLTHTYQASRLASVTDARGLTESYSYDYNNLLSSKVDKRGHTWRYASHFSTVVNSVVNPDGTTTTTTTGTSTDALDISSTTTYNAANKQVGSTDAIGNTTASTYSTDGKNDLLSTTVTGIGTGSNAFQATTHADGYANGLPTTFKDAYNYPSSVIYDPNGWGYVISATDANGIVTHATYNALGWKLSSWMVVNGQTRTTSYIYDAWGRLTVVIAPDGTATGTVYDPNGNVLRVADADAYAATPLYAVHCDGGAVGHFSADAYYSGGSGSGTNGADTSAVAAPAPAAVYQTARVGTFTYTFPGLTPGQLYTLRLHFVESGYGAAGQRQFNVAVNGGAALTNFDIFAAAGAKDKANIQEFSVSANGSGQIAVAFTAGAAGAPVCSGIEVLPFVHTVANNYDADDRLVSTIGGTGNGNGDIVSYTYDGPNGYGSPDTHGDGLTQKGLLSSKTDGNNHTTYYTYTVRGEPYQTFYADSTHESIGTSATNSYDEDGNVLARVKADGKVISYAYDFDNRLTDITYPTLPAVHFDYDLDGRKTHMHDGTGDTYWYYDDGLHVKHQSSGRGDVYYTYYLTGSRWTMMAPGVNPSQPNALYTYTYDPGLRLTSLTNPFNETTTFAYNDDGTVKQRTLSDGAYTSYGYNPVSGLLTGLSFNYPGLGGSYSHTYGYEPNGSLSSRSESDGGTNTFGYDGMGQLVSEVRTGPVPFLHTYTYDHNGNRLTESVNGTQVQSFSYDGHDKLSGAGGSGESETYDLNGNLKTQTVAGQTTAFTWDDEDRLTSQQFPDGHTDSYTYNGLGMRLTKSDPTGSYSYFNDGASPASDVLSDGYSTFTPGISEYNSLGSRFYLPDGQGNSRGLLDGSQNATDGYNWDAWGNIVSRFGSNPTGYAWNVSSGYQSDGDSGLKLLGHRYLDSRTGRFISQDPAEAGDNWYAYCGNDPTEETDPLGLDPAPDGIDQQTWDENTDKREANLAGQEDYLSSQFPGATIQHDQYGFPFVNSSDGMTVYAGMVPGNGALVQAIDNVVTGGMGVKAVGAYYSGDNAAAVGYGLAAFGMVYLSIESGGGGGAAKSVLFHYTSEAGEESILTEMALNASKVGGKDARYGSGQYLTDLGPGSMRPGQIARRLWGQPFVGNKMDRVIKIDVTDLPVENPAPHIFRIPGEEPLPLTGRIVP